MNRPLTAGLVGLAVLGTTLVAQVAPAAAAGCHYEVLWPVAGVYVEPHQQDRYKIKNKYRGDIVGQRCSYTISDGYEWQLVDLGGGPSNDVGWMRADAVRRIS